MLGKGSSGKRLIMKLIKLSIECYMIEFKNDTFSKGNNKQDKNFNSIKKKNLRYANGKKEVLNIQFL